MAGYIGTTPVPQATQHRESFTATGGQTSFATAGYTPQFIDVYLNGVKLAPADYTATNGSDVVLASGATASDILEIVAYTPFEVANQTFTGDTSVTNLAVTGTFTSRGIDDNADAVAITIDSSENVGIGTSSPSSFFGDSYLVVGDGTGTPTSTIYGSSTGTSYMLFADGTTGSAAYRGGLEYNHASDYLGVFANGSERMRIDSSGNLLVGTTDSNVANQTGTTQGVRIAGAQNIQVASTGISAYFNKLNTDGAIVEFRKSGTTVGSIGTEVTDSTLQADVYIHGRSTVGGTNANNSRLWLLGGDSGIVLDGHTNAILPTDENSYEDNRTDIGSSSYRFKDLYLSGGLRGDTTFKNNAGTTEYARFDSSGTLLVGKTSGSIGTAGSAFYSYGLVESVRDGNKVMTLNRLTSDGDIVQFRKDGTTVGSIACRSSGGNLQINTIQSGIDFAGSGWLPLRNGVIVDNDLDIGNISNRFDDIFATNGTIQTSDRNEKQDIAELSDAEQRVAVAAKGLLRKFRWKDAVAEKGDEARTHFGIIAQDLQAAFAAEGLDAGDYAMFISSTWTDEETGEERTRMGVRYSELLAFIIAVI